MTDGNLDERALLAALRFDEAALDGVLQGASPTLGSGWKLDGDAEALLQRAEQDALAAKRADAVVHAAALRALHLSRNHSRLHDAVEIARRASRMARTEAQPEMEYLAHLILARVRRLSGRPYLATRILSALSRYAPPAWHRWIGWELCMSAGLSAPEQDWGPPASLLRRALTHAVGGEREGWAECIRALRRETWPLVAHDVAQLVAVVDVHEQGEDATIQQWSHGEIDAPPNGLLGLASGENIGSLACIVTQGNGDRQPRRILRLGAGLAQTDDSVELEPTHRRSARVDRMLAVLALRPAGLEFGAVFRAVWGFKFVESVHSEAFEVTLHRARERLGEHARIDRAEGSLCLVASKRLLVPDPRCTPDVDERLLQHVASHGSVNARDAARALGMSLRAVQSALKDLVESGACERRRDGRSIVYGVEDTTFREPTAY